MMIKLSDEQMAKWGFKSQAEVEAALDKATEKPKADLTPVIPPTVPPASPDVSSQILSRLTSVEISVAGINKESFLEAAKVEAKKVASSEVSAAIARSGGQALKQESQPVDAPIGGKPAIESNDFGAHYDADKNIQDEFISKSSYVKYRQAQEAGRIREHSARN